MMDKIYMVMNESQIVIITELFSFRIVTNYKN